VANLLTVFALLGALSVCAAPAAAQRAATEVVTRVELVRSNGQPAAGVPADEAVVAWTPRRAPAAAAPARQPEEFSLVTRGKAFRPDALAVPAGSRVWFPNEDPILHNVFSVSEGNAFDLGLYQRGEGEAVQFDTPGLVRVFCNVHRDMYAFLLVVDSTIIGRGGRDGSVVLNGVPPGPGTLTVWHPRGELQTTDYPGPGSIPAALELEVGRRQVPPHTNKFGRPYRDTRRYDG
jgi:plastocyanin